MTQVLNPYPTVIIKFNLPVDNIAESDLKPKVHVHHVLRLI